MAKWNIALVHDFVQKNFVSKGADVTYHIKDKNGEDHNPHVHIMLTMRPMTKSGICVTPAAILSREFNLILYV